MKEKVSAQSRATTSDLLRRPKYSKRNSPVKKSKMTISSRDKNKKISNIKVQAKISKKRMRPNIVNPNNPHNRNSFEY